MASTGVLRAPGMALSSEFLDTYKVWATCLAECSSIVGHDKVFSNSLQVFVGCTKQPALTRVLVQGTLLQG